MCVCVYLEITIHTIWRLYSVHQVLDYPSLSEETLRKTSPQESIFFYTPTIKRRVEYKVFELEFLNSKEIFSLSSYRVHYALEN